MGFLADVFGLGGQIEMPPIPTIQTVVPDVAANEIRNGRLPQFKTNTLMLHTGEICHYIERVVLITTKKERQYESRRNGASYRIFKGMTMHTGNSRTTPVTYDVPVYTEGVLYVTNSRVVFSAKEKSFERKLQNLTAITPYLDAIGLQYGSQTYNFLVPQADLIENVLRILY